MSVKLRPSLRRSTSSGGRSKSLFETAVVRAARFGRRRVATDLVQVGDGDAALDQQPDRDVARVGRGQPVGRVAVELARDLLQRRDGGHLLGDHHVGAVQDVADAVGQARRLGVDLGLGERVAVVGHAGGEQVLHVEVGHPQAAARRARNEGRVVDRALVDLRRRAPLRDHLVLREGEAERADGIGHRVEEVGVHARGRGRRVRRVGRIDVAGARVLAEVEQVGGAHRQRRGAEHALARGAGPQEELAELVGAAGIGGADRQAHAHALEGLVVGARAVGQRRLGRAWAGSMVTGAGRVALPAGR